MKKILCLCFMLSGNMALEASTSTWTGTVDNIWRNDNNWTLAPFPGQLALNNDIAILSTKNTSISNPFFLYLAEIQINATGNHLENSAQINVNGSGVTGDEVLTITNNFSLEFTSASTAGNSIITNDGILTFFNSSQAPVTTVIQDVNGILSLQNRNNALQLGSLSGAGIILPENGDTTLFVGHLEAR